MLNTPTPPATISEPKKRQRGEGGGTIGTVKKDKGRNANETL